MLNLIWDISKRKGFDSSFDSGYRVKTINEQVGRHSPLLFRQQQCYPRDVLQTALDYLKFKGVLFVSGRDFSNLVHWRVRGGCAKAITAFIATPGSFCPYIYSLSPCRSLRMAQC